MHLGKFVHTETGRIIMSVLLGFGLASLFRKICKNKECLLFYAPPLDKIEDKIYKQNGKCLKYSPVAAKCNSNLKTILFE